MAIKEKNVKLQKSIATTYAKEHFTKKIWPKISKQLSDDLG